MNANVPITLHDEKPASIDALVTLLDNLTDLDMQGKPVTRPELKDVFDQLSNYYLKSEYHGQLPITVEELAKVYDSIALADSALLSGLEEKDPSAFIDVYDLTFLLETLADNYAIGPGVIEEFD